MKIEIIKAVSGKYCEHASCKKEKKYVTPKGRIRVGNTAARLTFRVMTSRRFKEMSFYYCRPCIDQLLLDCRAGLDHKLWIFS